MLQILLAFLAISIISTAGYGLVEQLSLQQVMSDQRENIRRLDVAADAIQARLVTMPGVDGVYAPAPNNLANGWSYMPAGLGGINATVDGVQFLYCPLAPATGAVNQVVKNADGSSYGIQVKSGVVTGSAFGTYPGGIAAYRPVAFIIAAGRTAAAPPRCSGVRERNGRPYVDGGLVKIVSTPINSPVVGVGTIAASTSDLYVSNSGSGSGRQGDPASLDDALLHWARFHPSQMTIHLTGDVVASGAAWAEFAPALAASSGRLTFDGAGHAVTAPAGQVGSPGVLSLINVSLYGPTLLVGEGEVLNTRGFIVLGPGAGGSGLFVQSGGRLNVSAGTLRIAGSAEYGIESQGGDIVLSSAIVASDGRPWSLGINNGGRLWATNSTIGDPGSRNSAAGLAVSGTTSINADAASRVAAASSGVCWTASGNDVTYSTSTNSNGQGTNSAVFPDPVNPGLSLAPGDPGYEAQFAEYQAYRRQVDLLQRARQTNHSNFTCI